MTDDEMVAVGFGVFHERQEESQSAGGDVFQLGAVKDDFLALTFVERLQGAFCLYAGGGVEFALQADEILVGGFFDCN